MTNRAKMPELGIYTPSWKLVVAQAQPILNQYANWGGWFHLDHYQTNQGVWWCVFDAASGHRLAWRRTT